MKVKFCKTIFFMVVFALSIVTGVYIKPLNLANATNSKTIEFCSKGYKLIKTEEELGFKGDKYGFSSSELALKVYNMGFDYKDIINYIYPAFNSVVLDLCKAINVEPVDSFIDVRSGIPIITDEVQGVLADTNKLYLDLFLALIKNEGYNIVLEIETTTINAVKTRAENYLLANEKSSFTTYINGVNQEGRINNIKRALSMFNGMEIKPGEEISFNNIIGDTTKENGYSLAKVILNGKYADDYGGGVCQAATTLYNASLIAGLDIVEANPHSLKVGYVKGSFDAMVSAGVSDLRIKNPYINSVYIYTYANDYECGVKIFGEVNEFEIIRRSNRLEFNEEEFPKIAYKSEGYLDYYKNGELIKTERIRKDNYYKLKVDETPEVIKNTSGV